MDDLIFCINYLKEKNEIKDEVEYNFYTFRSLLNITLPFNLSDEFYIRQDKVIKEELNKDKIIDINSLEPVVDNIYLYKGDITRLKADAIVNAGNSHLLGCFVPNHHCIDNCIHSFAGLQVRRDLMDVMLKQGENESEGKCKVTFGYNLPSKYIFHTVGPIYSGSDTDKILLANCYKSCLKEADKLGLNNIVFCSISSGEFGYPIRKSSQVAINAVKEYLETNISSVKKVIFDVFSDDDYYIYLQAINNIYR